MVARVALIGCGPCGMSTLYHFAKMPEDKRPQIVCFEKQSTWGGLWNYTWRTAVDEYGEPVHSGMYRDLWSNGPKECLEYPDYTFDDHFGKAIPSFPPREVLREYLEGRFMKTQVNLDKLVRFSTVVRRVEYHRETDDFTVVAKSLDKDEESTERFTHVIVATGIFSVPNVPNLPGIDDFHGKIIHAHEFKDARDFKGERILIVGASYSAEDLALQTMKFGAEKVTTCWRSKPMNFKWPTGIDERPLVKEFRGNIAIFSDGTTDDFDSIILCTGYKKHYPFLPDDLRLKDKLTVYPDNLYKGTVWMNGGNGKLLYLGTHDQYYTFTMFDVQALWACRYITGDLNIPSRQEMLEDVKKWRQREATLKDCHDDINFQTDFVLDLCKDLPSYDKRVGESRDLFHKWEHQRDEDIATYRDKQFNSIFTGTMAPSHHTTWMKAIDDSRDAFVNQSHKK